MKIAIHHEPSGPGLGGGDVVSAVLAHLLRGRHQVDLLHHRPWLTAERWASFTTVDLDGVEVCYVEPTPEAWDGGGPPRWASLAGPRLRRWMGWMSRLSAPYDLFISVTHGAPPFCDASVGVLYVLFPMLDYRWLSTGQGMKASVRRRLQEARWRRRMATYAEQWAISQFSADWAAARFGTPCAVVPPPVLTDVVPGEKEDVIVAVGRFVPTKMQLEMVRAFRRVAERLPGWELVCLGTLSDDPAERDYFRAVEEAAAGAPVRLVTNATRDELRAVLGRAKLFCHAMGAGNDERIAPERSEHFGLVTVEAMFAGCVPVVVNRGGQREIVRDGQDGLLWDSWEQLDEQLVRLAGDEGLRQRMASAAVARAAEFGRDRFAAQVRGRLARYLGE